MKRKDHLRQAEDSHIDAIGLRLRQAREALGISQSDFAAMVGVSFSTQRRYETGARNITLGYLMRLGSAGISAEAVLMGTAEWDCLKAGQADTIRHAPAVAQQPSAATRASIASKQAVAALHDVALVLSASIHEMADAIDRAALREAMQLVTDVAIKHDELGRYGVYPAVDAEEDDIL